MLVFILVTKMLDSSHTKSGLISQQDECLLGEACDPLGAYCSRWLLVFHAFVLIDNDQTTAEFQILSIEPPIALIGEETLVTVAVFSIQPIIVSNLMIVVDSADVTHDCIVSSLSVSEVSHLPLYFLVCSFQFDHKVMNLI
jgi:hypothetical protein